MIKATYLQQVRLMAFFSMMNNVKDYALSENLEELKLKDFFENEFMPAYETFDASLGSIRKSEHTKEINNLSKKRDKLATSFNLHLRAYKNFPDAGIVEATSRVILIYEKLGKNTHMLGLTEKSGKYINLIDELQKENTKRDIQKINATKWVDEINTLNNEIQRLFKERIKHESTIETGKAGDARAKMQKTFTDFCKRINALVLLEGKEKYQSLLENINREVERTKQIVKTRSKKPTTKENEV